MAEVNYDTLKKDFHEWLKVQAQQSNSLLDAEKIDQINLQNITVTYSKEFKEFLATRNDVGEENYVKSTINAEKEDLNFLDEMFDDFIAGLSPEDSVYKAIDTNSNKTISKSEKNNFFEKNKGRTKEGMLKRWTIILGIVFVLNSIALSIIYIA